MHYEVIIAGGGFAGAYCGRRLGKRLGTGAVQRVALIAERNVLVFHPMLAEVAGSALAPRDVAHPLREFCRKIDVLQGQILRIDWATKTLVLDGGRFTRNHTVTFDHLVLALGTVTDLSKVPGLTEYGWPMKSVADALRLRTALINRLEEANLVEDAEIRGRLLTFVVVGGGYTGVETAGQIADFLHEAKQLYVHLRHEPLRVILVHSRAHLLEEIGSELGDYAQRVLEKRGVEVKLTSRVAEVTATKVLLGDGSSIDANTLVATIGSAPHPLSVDLARQLNLEHDRGRIRVDPFCNVPEHSNLWVIGDGAAVPWVDRGESKIAPPTAQLALREGEQLGENLCHALAGRRERMRPFTYRYQGQLATVGEREAVAEIWGLRFSGFVAWWLWRTIYLAKLPGAMRRLRVMIDWTFELFFPRDISVTQPPPDEPIRSIHLEKGEALVQQGESVRGLYYLKRGHVVSHPDGNLSFVAPAVIDLTLAKDDRWQTSLIASESSDIVVLRTKALALLREGLVLTTRPEKQ